MLRTMRSVACSVGSVGCSGEGVVWYGEIYLIHRFA